MKICETSTGYEKLAQRIYQDILELDGVDNIDVQHNVKVKGKSGVEHQIDVYWEYKYAGISHKVLIECKHYSHKVSLLHVRNMHGLLTDIPNSSGILVTTEGYQSGAVEYAVFYEMGLKLIRKPKNEDWDGCVQIVNIDIHFTKNNYLDIQIELDGNHPETVTLAPQYSEMSSPTIELIIRDADSKPCSFISWLDKALPINDDWGTVRVETMVPPKAFIVLPDGNELKLGRIVVKYSSSESQRSLTFDAMSLAEAVLEDYKTGDVEHIAKK